MRRTLYCLLCWRVVSLAILVWRVKPVASRALSSKQLALASALFWGSVVTVLVYIFGKVTVANSSHQANAGCPVGRNLGLSILESISQMVGFAFAGESGGRVLLVGGLQSIPEHAIAICRSKILDLPILQGRTPLSIFIFSYFEYLVFWSLVLALALVLQRVFKLRS